MHKKRKKSKLYMFEELKRVLPAVLQHSKTDDKTLANPDFLKKIDELIFILIGAHGDEGKNALARVQEFKVKYSVAGELSKNEMLEMNSYYRRFQMDFEGNVFTDVITRNKEREPDGND